MLETKIISDQSATSKTETSILRSIAVNNSQGPSEVLPEANTPILFANDTKKLRRFFLAHHQSFFNEIKSHFEIFYLLLLPPAVISSFSQYPSTRAMFDEAIRRMIILMCQMNPYLREARTFDATTLLREPVSITTFIVSCGLFFHLPFELTKWIYDRIQLHKKQEEINEIIMLLGLDDIRSVVEKYFNKIPQLKLSELISFIEENGLKNTNIAEIIKLHESTWDRYCNDLRWSNNEVDKIAFRTAGWAIIPAVIILFIEAAKIVSKNFLQLLGIYWFNTTDVEDKLGAYSSLVYLWMIPSMTYLSVKALGLVFWQLARLISKKASLQYYKSIHEPAMEYFHLTDSEEDKNRRVYTDLVGSMTAPLIFTGSMGYCAFKGYLLANAYAEYSGCGSLGNVFYSIFHNVDIGPLCTDTQKSIVLEFIVIGAEFVNLYPMVGGLNTLVHLTTKLITHLKYFAYLKSAQAIATARKILDKFTHISQRSWDNSYIGLALAGLPVGLMALRLGQHIVNNGASMAIPISQLNSTLLSNTTIMLNSTGLINNQTISVALEGFFTQTCSNADLKDYIPTFPTLQSQIANEVATLIESIRVYGDYIIFTFSPGCDIRLPEIAARNLVSAFPENCKPFTWVSALAAFITFFWLGEGPAAAFFFLLTTFYMTTKLIIESCHTDSQDNRELEFTESYASSSAKESSPKRYNSKRNWHPIFKNHTMTVQSPLGFASTEIISYLPLNNKPATNSQEQKGNFSRKYH